MNKNSSDKASNLEHALNNLCWQKCVHDDQSVAKILFDKKEINSISGLDETGLLDDFFRFLDKYGLWPKLEKLNGPTIKRVMVGITEFLVLYMLKLIYNIKHMSELDDLLFSNLAAMKLVGFNAYQSKYGVCKRGSFRRKHKEVSGPITAESLAENLIKIPVRQMENFFNNCIKCLAKSKIFPKKLWVIIDGTDIETKPNFQGAGSVTREKKVENKIGKTKTVKVTVSGFKLIALFAVGMKIPIAVKVVQIQRHESRYTLALLKTAQKNLAIHAKIVELLADRGFLDGEDLWEINDKMKIRFVVPAKEKMHVKIDARSLAQQKGAEITHAERIVEVKQGHGVNSKIEKLVTEVHGVSSLNTFSTYGTAAHTKDKNKKEFQANPINAVVITKWKNHDYGWDKAKVFLTNMDVKDPFVAFDAYDERSFIENSLFRQSKQNLYLKYPMKKTKEGIHLHLIFTMAVHALIYAYRHWSEKQYSLMKNGRECGLKRFWRKLKAENRDKVIIFVDEKYAIMNAAECMMLLGARVKEYEELGLDRKAVLNKFGLEQQ